jgi:hypothetical protein
MVTIEDVRDMLAATIPTYDVEQILTLCYGYNTEDAKALIQEAKSTPITSIFGTTIC